MPPLFPHIRLSLRRVTPSQSGARLAEYDLGKRALKLYCINATSRLGRRVQSGPWSARWIRRKVMTYESGSFADIVIIDMSAKQTFTIAQFLAHHSVGDDGGGDWQLDI